MESLVYSFLLILGLVFGSFFTVVASRVPQMKSIISPSSSCTSCGNKLQIIDLVPVLSWCFLKGKCRSCQQRISPIYPLAELMTGLLFVVVAYVYGYSWETVIGLLFVSLTVIIVLTDIVYMIVPNVILLAFSIPIALITSIFDWSHLGSHLLGALAGGGILLIIALLSKGGMGMGDIKLFALTGFVVGFPYILLALMLACFTGFLVATFLLAIKAIKRRQPIPFAPFLLLGSWIALLYGRQIFELYSSIIA